MLHTNNAPQCCADADEAQANKKRRKALDAAGELAQLQADINALEAAAGAQVRPTRGSPSEIPRPGTRPCLSSLVTGLGVPSPAGGDGSRASVAG